MGGYRCLIFFIQLTVVGHFSGMYVLTNVINASLNIEVENPFKLRFS